MASMKCTVLAGKQYNSGWGNWNDWPDTDIKGYAGVSGAGKKYCTVIKIKTPDIADSITSSSLTFDLPFVRPTNATFAEEGTFYFKIYSSDPTSDDIDKVMPTKSAKDGSASWSSSDHEVGIAECEIETTALVADHVYYIAIGSSELIQVGDDNKKQDGQAYSFTLNYTLNYTSGTAPTIYIVDNKDNTITISGALGKNGTSNSLQYAAVYYTTDGSDPGDSENTKRKRVLYYSVDTDDNYASPVSGGSYSTTIGITSSGTIKATTRCAFEHNTTEANTSLKVTYYAMLGDPGIPVLTDSSYKNGRIVIKKPWTFIWTPTKILESSLTVAGYEYALRRLPKDFTVWGPAAEIGTVTGTSVSFSDPVALGFAAGDIFKLQIISYAIDGRGEKITSDLIESSEYLVQNAGIVNVKVDGAWKEGQVYVKVNNEWKEAETVNVKVNGEWQESQ